MAFGASARKLQQELALLPPLQREHHDACVQADQELAAARQDYASRVQSADRQIAEAGSPRVLGSFGGVVLTELSVVLNGRTYPLRPGIRCEIDATGDVQRYATSRATLTRMAAGGMLLGKSGVAAGAAARKTSVHAIDSRQLYLIVTGPDWQEVVRIDPNYGPGARRFAAQVFSASQQAQALAEEHRRRWFYAQQARAAAVADTYRLQVADSARRVLEHDPLDLLRAQLNAGAQVSAPGAVQVRQALPPGPPNHSPQARWQ